MVLIDAAVPEGPSRPPRRPGAARVGMLIAAVALFAFGVVAGRATLSFESGQALRGEDRSPAASASPAPDPTPSTEPVTDQAPTRDATTDPGEPDHTATVPFTQRQINNVCGRPTPIAQVGYVAPLPTPVDMTILGGDPPRSANLKTGVIGPPLLELDDGLFTDLFATDSDGTVVVLRSCNDPMQATVVRVSRGGDAKPIAIPDGWRSFGSLIRIDEQIWLALYPPDSGMPAAAISPDGRRSASTVLNTDGTPGYDIRVTDRQTGQTATAPGIRLGTAHPLLTFSPDSRWLIVTVATLVGEQILLYGPDDLTGPYSIPGTVLHPNPAALPIYPSG